MITLKHAAGNVAPVLYVAAMMLYGSTAVAQSARRRFTTMPSCEC